MKKVLALTLTLLMPSLSLPTFADGGVCFHNKSVSVFNNIRFDPPIKKYNSNGEEYEEMRKYGLSLGQKWCVTFDDNSHYILSDSHTPKIDVLNGTNKSCAPFKPKKLAKDHRQRNYKATGVAWKIGCGSSFRDLHN